MNRRSKNRRKISSASVPPAPLSEQEEEILEYKRLIVDIRRKSKTRLEYWIFDEDKLVRAGDRPLILRSKKTAAKLIEEMGMGETWRAEERPALVPETRGRRVGAQSVRRYHAYSYEACLRRAWVAWLLMKPDKRPTKFADQLDFVKLYFSKHFAVYTKSLRNILQKKKAVRKIMQEIRRQARQAGNPAVHGGFEWEPASLEAETLKSK